MRDALPAFLVDPPWEQQARAHRDAGKGSPLVPGLEPPAGRSVVWEPGEREEWQKSIRAAPSFSVSQEEVLATEGWEGIVRLFQAGELTHEPAVWSLFMLGPEELVRPLLADWRPVLGPGSDFAILRAMPARFGADARHVVFPNAKAHKSVWALMPFLDAETAGLMTDWLGLKSMNYKARPWFVRHGLAAVPFLVPDALGKRRAQRDKAKSALALIASEHGAPEVVEAARRHGDAAAEAVAQILDVQPAKQGPAEKPAQPLKTPWLDRGGLPEVRLKDGRVLPSEAVGNLVGALTLCPGVPWGGTAVIYPGLDEVLDRCDRASLADLGRTIFDAWVAAGLPGRNGWVLDQLVWLADDEATRRLGATVLKWPGRIGNHATGVLANIGTDTALLQLHRIAQRASPNVRSNAEKRLAWTAERRGLTPGELADRLVPDLGLDAAGTLVLDYGPRRFTVGFDEELKPFVIDEDGALRKTLPKPGAKDDADRAPAAYQRFATLKKEVRAVAADQIRRLEQAMVDGRRWSRDDFRRYVVEHPLLRHIARRLVWTTQDTPFRIAEDLTFADIGDDPLTLPDDARIGIPHPLEIGYRELGDAVPDWAKVFADYAILQPFPQLARPMLALTDDERRTGRLGRFEGVTVPVGAVLGLTRRGWERGPAGDGGVQYEVFRRVRKGLDLVVELDPGIAAGAADLFPEQKLREVRFTEPPGETLSPVMACELLGDLAIATGSAR
ncbi:DUF4132 domain-containing protein [Spirillospora sp. CA-255316]